MSTPSFAGFDLSAAFDDLRERITSRVEAHTGGKPSHGDIRSAVLTSLSSAPMHGYQIIQDIESRTHGAFTPGAGLVYPTLQLLTDEGLVAAEQVGERKVYSLTDAGKIAAAQLSDGPAESASSDSWNLKGRAELPKAGAKLAQAIGLVAQHGSAEQAKTAAAIVDEARRKLYAILAED